MKTKKKIARDAGLALVASDPRRVVGPYRRRTKQGASYAITADDLAAQVAAAELDPARDDRRTPVWARWDQIDTSHGARNLDGVVTKRSLKSIVRITRRRR